MFDSLQNRVSAVCSALHSRDDFLDILHGCCMDSLCLSPVVLQSQERCLASASAHRNTFLISVKAGYREGWITFGEFVVCNCCRRCRPLRQIQCRRCHSCLQKRQD